MATISKFYLHSAATTNTGTMPSGAFLGTTDGTGDASGARTIVRATDQVIGVLQTSAAFASNADQIAQHWGFARFVSPPLAATTFAAANGNWTLSAASAETSLLHNQSVQCTGYLWRPNTGLRVGSTVHGMTLAEPTSASTETAATSTGAWLSTQAILDGDIIVWEFVDSFIQGHSSSYTSTFYYDGDTEASTTSCASFITPPAALTLFGGGTTYTKAGFAKESA